MMRQAFRNMNITSEPRLKSYRKVSWFAYIYIYIFIYVYIYLYMYMYSVYVWLSNVDDLNMNGWPVSQVFKDSWVSSRTCTQWTRAPTDQSEQTMSKPNHWAHRLKIVLDLFVGIIRDYLGNKVGDSEGFLGIFRDFSLGCFTAEKGPHGKSSPFFTHHHFSREHMFGSLLPSASSRVANSKMWCIVSTGDSNNGLKTLGGVFFGAWKSGVGCGSFSHENLRIVFSNPIRLHFNQHKNISQTWCNIGFRYIYIYIPSGIQCLCWETVNGNQKSGIHSPTLTWRWFFRFHRTICLGCHPGANRQL